jgi:hypothetical protein
MRRRIALGHRGQHLAGGPPVYLIFGDIEGKLEVLCVECTKCARKGRYSIRRLIDKYGRNAN